MIEKPAPAFIPNGRWRRIVGTILCVFGILPLLAASRDSTAGAVASICFALGGPLIFWGIMLGYLNVLERRLMWIANCVSTDGRSAPSTDEHGENKLDHLAAASSH